MAAIGKSTQGRPKGEYRRARPEGTAMRPPDIPVALYHRSMLDMSARSRGGIVLHAPLWLVVGWLGGVAQSHPLLYVLLLAMFMTVLAARLSFEQALASKAAHHAPSRAFFFAFILSSPLMWGVISAATLYWAISSQLQQMLSLVVAGLVSSGSIVFAINARLRSVYSLAAMLPTVIVAVTIGNELAAFFVVGCTMLHLYLMHAARVIHADYWAAARGRVELENRARELERLSLLDPLTQAYNRQHFDRQLQIEWQRAARDKRPLSVLMIDADHFKQVNDRHGHLAGDECLRRMSAALRDNLRDAGDVLARFGGEEFVVLLPGADSAAALTSAERLRGCVQALGVQVAGTTLQITCSIGIHTLWPHRIGQNTDLLRGADQALYIAKAMGRNRVALAPHPDSVEMPAAALHVEP